jgi:ribosomal protein S18 acetylase RimI-like enzyme
MSSIPSDGVSIRAATTDDARAIAAFAGRLSEFEIPAWRTADVIAGADERAVVEAVRAGRDDDQVFIAERGGDPVGCLHIYAEADFFGLRHAHISVIATSAEAEGSGVGRALMAHAERWARDRGLTLLTLNVFAANARARRFYERAGYVPEIVKYAKPIGS